jgi:hypothetical protein
MAFKIDETSQAWPPGARTAISESSGYRKRASGPGNAAEAATLPS